MIEIAVGLLLLALLVMWHAVFAASPSRERKRLAARLAGRAATIRRLLESGDAWRKCWAEELRRREKAATDMDRRIVLTEARVEKLESVSEYVDAAVRCERDTARKSADEMRTERNAAYERCRQIEAELTRVREQRDRARGKIGLITEAVADLDLTVELHGVPIISEMNAETAAKSHELAEDDDPFDVPAKPDNPADLSPYEEFAAEVRAAGLTARDCGHGHWQITLGQRLVNVWAETKKGFRMQADGQEGQSGSVKEAIKLAGEWTGMG